MEMFATAGFDGYFKVVNPAFQAFLGLSADELLGRPYLDFVHPDDVASTVAEAAKLRDGVDSIAFENRYRCQDGSYRWLHWSATAAVADEETYCVAWDMTERRIQDDRLHQSERLESLGQLAGGIAHDFNNLLAAIMNYAAFVADEVADRPAVLADVEQIQVASQRAARLTKQLLDLRAARSQSHRGARPRRHRG